MKKILATTILLLSLFNSNAQTTSIPDTNFEIALINLGYDSGPLDGLVTTANISGVTSLDVSNSNIFDMTGINDFTSLVALYCNQNQLSQLILSSLTNLDTLNCATNLIDSLNITTCTSLQELYCDDNLLNNLDITQNINLTKVNFSWNNISSIDVSQNTALIDLRGDYNQLTSIDVTPLSSLTKLFLSSNLLTSIDLTQNPGMMWLNLSYNIGITSLDVTQNPAITSLYVHNNQIDTLDLSQNTALMDLGVASNNLNGIDFSSNPNLYQIQLQNNNISSVDLTVLPSLQVFNVALNPIDTVDVTQNPNLTSLDVQSTGVTSVDLSQNPNLVALLLSNTGFTSIDLSNNLLLEGFIAINTYLTELDLSNHPNMNQLNVENNPLECLSIVDPAPFYPGWFVTTGNPNLTCINTIDPQTAIATLSADIDPWTTFGLNCLCSTGSNSITGDIQIDNDLNCIGEGALENTIVYTDAGDYGISDSTGQYILYAGTGPVQVDQLPVNSPLFIQQTCPSPPGSYNLNFTGTGQAQTGIDFRNEVEPCPLLTTSVTSMSRHKCFTSPTYITYCNEGFADTNNVRVYLDLPPDISLLSASMTYTQTPQGYYMFDIGTLQAGECGEIIVIDSVSCVTAPLGEYGCTRAWIIPENSCLYDFTNTSAWDNSDLQVTGSCYSDTNLLFVINNVGTGNMSTYTDYRIYKQGTLVYTDSLQLNSGDSLVVTGYSNAAEYWLEVDQTPGYPSIANENFVVESCLLGSTPSYYSSIRPNEDGDPNLSVDCMLYTGSYDPNDKHYNPPGVGPNYVVSPGTKMDYTVRFMNTGTDTAKTVVIADTISPLLDLSTFALLGHSDPVEISFIGSNPPVMKFSFLDINLPDSTTDFLGSQGFVRFSLSPMVGLPLGTEIHNEADIYFDYNDPIITNDAWYTIDQGLQQDPGFVVNAYVKVDELDNEIPLFVFPNPGSEELTIDLGGYFSSVSYTITDFSGKVVYVGEAGGVEFIKFNPNLSQGIYFLNVERDGQPVERIKLERIRD